MAADSDRGGSPGPESDEDAKRARARLARFGGAQEVTATEGQAKVEKRAREAEEERRARSEERESRKAKAGRKGVRGRGPATFPSAAAGLGPREEPPAADPTRVLKIEGLKRPYTDKQLRDALQGEGTGSVDGRQISWFWLNHNKSVCFAEFEKTHEAEAARTELYDRTWPDTSHAPGRLDISFTTRREADGIVAAEPVGVVRDPISARLGCIPGVAGLRARGERTAIVEEGGGMRGFGSLAVPTGGARKTAGRLEERTQSAACQGGGVHADRQDVVPSHAPSTASLGPVGGVAGFGVAGGAHGAGAAGVGGATRGWGSLAGAAPSPRASGMDRGFGSDGHFGDDRHGADGRWTHGGARRGDGARSNDKPLRLEDVFNKTKTKPEIYWKPNARAVRDRRLDELRAAQIMRGIGRWGCWLLGKARCGCGIEA